MSVTENLFEPNREYFRYDKSHRIYFNKYLSDIDYFTNINSEELKQLTYINLNSMSLILYRFINQYLLFDFMVENKLIDQNLYKYKKFIMWNALHIRISIRTHNESNSLYAYLYMPLFQINYKSYYFLIKISMFDLMKLLNKMK